MPERQEIKRYTVSDTWKDYQVTLEVDHGVLTEERAKEINGFWSDDDYRVSDENGDVVRAVIRLFGQRMINLLLAEGGGCFSSQGEWPLSAGSLGVATIWTKDLHNEEGWGGSVEGDPYGWCGIRLLAADVENAAFDSVTLREVA